MTDTNQGIINIMHFNMQDNTIRHAAYWTKRKLEGEESVRTTFKADGIYPLLHHCRDAVIAARMPGTRHDLAQLDTEQRIAHLCPLCLPHYEEERNG